MKTRNRSVLTIMMIFVIVLVTACTPIEEIPAEQENSINESPTIEAVAIDELEVVETTQTNAPDVQESVAQIEEVDDTQALAKDTPDWFDVPLVDVRTGETFTINDHHGKVILVETLAMWCSSCLKQQKEVKALHELLSGEDRFVSIGLDIDINEKAEDLKAYTDNNQFDWLYVIAPVEVAREISLLYGAQFLNPPSTPILVIDKSGDVTLMNFGIKSADELYDFVTPLLSQ
jgi:hypothetical protein